MAIGIFNDIDMNRANGEVLTVTITLEEYRDLVKGSAQNGYKVLNDMMEETVRNLREELETVKMERDMLLSQVEACDVQGA